jgi:hypothetical protein
MRIAMTRSLSIMFAVFMLFACLCGCPRRPTAGRAPPTIRQAAPGDALATAVVAAVAAQLDLSPEQVLWNFPIARQPKAGDDVDLQELLNRLNEDQGKDCTMASLRAAAQAAADQELIGVITPELLAEAMARAPFKSLAPIPDPDSAIEIPAQPE